MQKPLLKDLLKSTCTHVHGGYHRNGIPVLYGCDHISNYITKQIEENQKMDGDDVKNVLNYFADCRTQYSYDSGIVCFSKNKELINIFKLMFQHTSLDDVNSTALFKFISVLIEMPFAYDLFPFLSKMNYELSDELYQQLIDKLRFSDDRAQIEYIADFVFRQIIKSEKLKQNLPVLTRCTEFCNNLAQFIDKFDGTIKPEYLLEACKGLPYTKNILLSLTGRGLEYNEETKEAVIAYCNAESIDYYLTNTRQPVIKKDVETLMQAYRYIGLQKKSARYYYDNVPVNKDGFNTVKGSGYDTEKMEILIKHGYNVTKADILFGIQFSCEILNVSRFNIVFDQEILSECWKYDFYPNYPFNCITPEMVTLQKACNKRAKSEISRIIKNHNLVPDQKCMENACKFKNNKPILDMLVGAGGKYTFKCIKNCASEMQSKETIMLIINSFEKQYEKEKQQYENKIKELEAKLKLQSTTNNNEDNPVIVEPIVTKEEEKIINQIIDDFTDSDLDKPEDIVDTVDTVIIDISKSKIPKSTKRKINVPKKYAEYFKKDPKTKMSFCDLKKELIDTIRDKNWIDEKNKTLIILPTDLNTKLGITPGRIKFEDIDKVTAMFY